MAPSIMLVAPFATMALIAFLTVVLSVESGRRVAVVHMKFGPHGRPLSVMIAKVARRGFNVPRASLVESIAFGSSHSGKEL